MITPAPIDRETTVESDTAKLLSILVLLALLRWMLPRDFNRLKLMVVILAAADMAVLSSLIYSFHIQYDVPLAAVLKAPAFGYFFLYIALRSVSLQAFNVVVTGVFATLGWAVLTYLSFLQVPPSGWVRAICHHIEPAGRGRNGTLYCSSFDHRHHGSWRASGSKTSHPYG